VQVVEPAYMERIATVEKKLRTAQLDVGIAADDASCDAQGLQAAIAFARATVETRDPNPAAPAARTTHTPLPRPGRRVRRAQVEKGIASDEFKAKIESAEARLKPLLEKRAAAEKTLRAAWSKTRAAQDTEALRVAIDGARAAGVSQAVHGLGDGESGKEYVATAESWRQSVLNARETAKRGMEAGMTAGGALLARAGLKGSIEKAVASGDEGVAPADYWETIRKARAATDEVTRGATAEILQIFKKSGEPRPPTPITPHAHTRARTHAHTHTHTHALSHTRTTHPPPSNTPPCRAPRHM
jgi:hypothetical protein